MSRTSRGSMVGQTMGMSPERRVQMQREMAKKDDWRAKCQKCGVNLVGTIEELIAHECEESRGSGH